MTGHSIKRAAGDRLEDMAACHSTVFPAQFSSRLGMRYLTAFYASYLQPQGIALVALGRNDDLYGFAVGGRSDILARFRAEARKDYLGLILRRAIFDRAVTKAILRAGWSSIVEKKPEARAGLENDPRAGLLQVIAVHDQAKGTGVASDLLAAFEGESRLMGYSRIWLEVDRGNTRAIAFYEKFGWERTATRHRMLLMQKKIG